MRTESTANNEHDEHLGADPTGDRSARRAVTVFPVLVLLAGALGLLLPGSFTGWSEAVPYLLGVVMFCMGITMTPEDFRGVVKRPWAVALGLVAHYVIMPGLGWAIAHLLDLPPQLAAGVILVGCAPSGTASNVVTYLARGDVALSVSVATVSTLVAPLVTPPLTLLLAGEYLPVDAGSMVTDILKTVLLPVLAGVVVRLLAGRYVQRALPALPWLSALTISVIVAVVVAVAIMIMPGVSIAGPDTAEAPRHHLVMPGETLWEVAVALDESADTRVMVDRLMRLNHLRSPLIAPGQSLLLP